MQLANQVLWGAIKLSFHALLVTKFWNIRCVLKRNKAGIPTAVSNFTKRYMLSTISHIFNPLRFLKLDSTNFQERKATFKKEKLPKLQTF